MKFFLKISTLFVLLTAGTISALAAGADHVDPEVVRAALERPSTSTPNAQSPAAAQKTSALIDFSMRGSGTQNSMTTGACSGVCQASAGHCDCLKFSGSLNATQVGNASWTANATVNLDDCTNTGTTNGFCCFSDGSLTANGGTGSSASTLGMTFTGLTCSDPNASLDTSIQGAFIILPSKSTGKFAHSTGTGQLDAYVAANNTTYLSGRGVLQVVSPF